MVKETRKGYKCEACDMGYKKQATAQACEDWCNKHKSCNLEIIKKAIKE